MWRPAGAERSWCLDGAVTRTRGGPQEMLRYVKRTQTKARQVLRGDSAEGAAPVVSGGGRQLGAAGEAVDRTVKCFLPRRGLLLTAVTSGQWKQSARGVGAARHTKTMKLLWCRCPGTPGWARGPGTQGRGGKPLDNCKSHQSLPRTPTPPPRPCVPQGGVPPGRGRGRDRVTLPSRHATAAPEADRQMGWSPGNWWHPATSAAIGGSSLTSHSPRQGRQWPAQHSP